MSVPPLQLRPISTSNYYTSGDVTIQPGAAIAPGVLLQADAHSRILIKSGACIGIGSILHAHSGVLEIGEGANIGAEVLLIGAVTIGANACVGSASTILNLAIAPGQIVPPGSLLGDNSRPVTELQATDTVVLPPPEVPRAAASEAHPETTAPGGLANATATPGMHVYGQVYVNQLLVKMFPHSHKTAAPNSSPTLNSSPPAQSDPWDD